jgi:hypothetical protein
MALQLQQQALVAKVSGDAISAEALYTSALIDVDKWNHHDAMRQSASGTRGSIDHADLPLSLSLTCALLAQRAEVRSTMLGGAPTPGPCEGMSDANLALYLDPACKSVFCSISLTRGTAVRRRGTQAGIFCRT